MRSVMAHVFDACRRHWIPIGVAPGVEVSLVVTPNETALLAPRDAGFYLYEAYLRLASLVARPVFARRLPPGQAISAGSSTPHERAPCACG